MRKELTWVTILAPRVVAAATDPLTLGEVRAAILEVIAAEAAAAVANQGKK